MKSNVIKLIIPLFLIVLFNVVMLPKTAVAQGNAFHWRFAGKGADATWESCDEFSCTYQSVYVSQTMYRENGTRFKGTTLSYYSSYYDANNDQYVYSYGFLENPTFTINNKLNSAHAAGTVQLSTCTYDPNTGMETCVDGGSADVNVTWSGYGDLYRGSSKSHIVSKSYTSNYMFKGSWRQANAVGSINGQNLGPVSWANIFNYRDASMTVCHGSC